MNTRFDPTKGPHYGQPILTAGKKLSEAQAVMIMLHGRGASAGDILMMADELAHPDFAYLAPQAAGNTWYPYSFMSPIDHNEPGISSGLATIAAVLDMVQEAGIPPEKSLLLGFSQGACLMSEFVARHARRYGGVAVLSGGLIGPENTPRDYDGSLAGTAVFLGCSDIDDHIPKERVQESADVLARLGGEVTLRLYPGMAHTVNRDEINIVRGMMTNL